MIIETEGPSFRIYGGIFGVRKVRNMVPASYYLFRGKIYPAALKLHKKGIYIGVVYNEDEFIFRNGVPYYKEVPFRGFEVIRVDAGGYPMGARNYRPRKYRVDTHGDYYLDKDLNVLKKPCKEGLRLSRCS